MTHYIVTLAGSVFSFKNASAARDLGLVLNTSSAPKQSAFIATDDDLSQIPTAVMVTLHNIIRPEKPIKKFADRETAEKRMKGVLEVLAKPGALAEPTVDADVQKELDGNDAGTTATEDGAGTPTTTEDTDMATAKGKTRKRAAKNTEVSANKGARPGRTSAFAGKVIRKVGETTRQEGSLGYASWKLIRDGMTYESFIAKGGRRKDLAWDIAKGSLKVEKA